MDRVKVLVTGAGAPGIKGTLYSLLRNPDGRKVTTVGVDMKADVLGRYLCDAYYQVPPAGDDGFVAALLDVCEREKVDVLLPQVTRELLPLARHRAAFAQLGTTVALSAPEAIAVANDKQRMLEAVRAAGEPCPAHFPVRTRDELDNAAETLGYPFVVKPPDSSGMRGFRVVHEHLDHRRAFFEEKPDSSALTLDELYGILGDAFPELIAMEYLPGPEYSVDILSNDDAVLAVVPRRRTLVRTGITFNGVVEKRADMIAISERLTRSVGLRYAHGLQFKEDAAGRPMLLESNPRIQGTMVLSTIAGANVIYGAVKLALGEPVPPFTVDWGARLMRYWGGVGIGKTVVEL